MKGNLPAGYFPRWDLATVLAIVRLANDTSQALQEEADKQDDPDLARQLLASKRTLKRFAEALENLAPPGVAEAKRET